jgi:regulator of protease activity HflC (stomatin/prohibitin superfamily)
MADQPTIEPLAEDYTQLTQVRVPLSKAADVFNTKDAQGLTPIVVLVEKDRRISNPLVIMALVVLGIGILFWVFRDNMIVGVASIIIALVLVGIAVWRSLYVLVPEGTSALLMQRGKYVKTLGPGLYPLSPFISVSHLVTRREIPFDVPVTDAPTRDSVRVGLDTLATFSIKEPFKFVFNLSASDFDRVFQAACQNTLRTLIRGVDSSEVNDLSGRDISDILTALSAAVEVYGVEVQKIKITYAQLPADFLASQEAQQLAILQQAEHAQRQVLAQRLQANQEILAQQATIAQVARENEALQANIQVAENRRRLVELEAEIERLRLERLQERLAAFPVAAQWEVDSAKLDIARGLASNTHAIVQVGNVSDITRAFVLADAQKNGAWDD